MQANVRLFCSVDKIMKHLCKSLGIDVDFTPPTQDSENLENKNNKNNNNNNNNNSTNSVPYNPKIEIPKGIPQLLHSKESIQKIVKQQKHIYLFYISFSFSGKHRN